MSDDTDHVTRESADKPWKDADLVNYLYHEEEMSGPEIAEEFGCSVKPIYDRIEDVRSFSEANKIWQLRRPASFVTTEDGYERVSTKIDGRVYSTAVHRLVAVAEHGVDALDGKIVHHKNGIPWDNRASNLELMSQSRHVREHLEEIPVNEKLVIIEMHRSTPSTFADLADIKGVPRSTISTIVARAGGAVQ